MRNKKNLNKNKNNSDTQWLSYRNSKVIHHVIAFVILKLSYDNKRWKKRNNLIGLYLA